MAVVTLTQADEDTLVGDASFQAFLVDQIIAKVRYYVGLASAPDVQTMKNFVYALTIQNNPNLPNEDITLVAYSLIRMAVRGINKKDTAVGSGVTANTIGYLTGAGTPIGFIVDDWFINKTKAF